jgi:hypothetical protein
MIQPLRTAHRWIFLGLGVLLPILLAAAVVLRPPAKTVSSEQFGADGAKVVGAFSFKLNGTEVSASLIEDSVSSDIKYLLRPTRGQFAAPELLLYWSSSGQVSSATLPADSQFITAIRLGNTFAIPQEDLRSGTLLLYDQPHKKILATLVAERR